MSHLFSSNEGQRRERQKGEVYWEEKLCFSKSVKSVNCCHGLLGIGHPVGIPASPYWSNIIDCHEKDGD